MKKKDSFYREFRCPVCRSLLAKEYIYAGRLQIKCHKCNEICDIDFKTTKSELLKLAGKKQVEEKKNAIISHN